jgi:hypothetical protein
VDQKIPSSGETKNPESERRMVLTMAVGVAVLPFEKRKCVNFKRQRFLISNIALVISQT